MRTAARRRTGRGREPASDVDAGAAQVRAARGERRRAVAGGPRYPAGSVRARRAHLRRSVRRIGPRAVEVPGRVASSISSSSPKMRFFRRRGSPAATPGDGGRSRARLSAARGSWYGERALVAHSSSGPGHRPLKAEIEGSNPSCATNRSESESGRCCPTRCVLGGEKRLNGDYRAKTGSFRKASQSHSAVASCPPLAINPDTSRRSCEARCHADLEDHNPRGQ